MFFLYDKLHVATYGGLSFFPSTRHLLSFLWHVVYVELGHLTEDKFRSEHDNSMCPFLRQQTADAAIRSFVRPRTHRGPLPCPRPEPQQLYNNHNDEKNGISINNNKHNGHLHIWPEPQQLRAIKEKPHADFRSAQVRAYDDRA